MGGWDFMTTDRNLESRFPSQGEVFDGALFQGEVSNARLTRPGIETARKIHTPTVVGLHLNPSVCNSPLYNLCPVHEEVTERPDAVMETADLEV